MIQIEIQTAGIKSPFCILLVSISAWKEEIFRSTLSNLYFLLLVTLKSEGENIRLSNFRALQILFSRNVGIEVEMEIEWRV